MKTLYDIWEALLFGSVTALIRLLVFGKGHREYDLCHAKNTKAVHPEFLANYSSTQVDFGNLGQPVAIYAQRLEIFPNHADPTTVPIQPICTGLYRKDYLNLPLPTIIGVKLTSQKILLQGGASLVSAPAIQLIVASGLTVLTTAYTANHNLVKSLGAHTIFDYRSPLTVEKIVNTLANTNFVGVYNTILEDTSFKAVSAILDRLKTTVKVASALLPYYQPTTRFAPKHSEFLIEVYCLVYTRSTNIAISIVPAYSIIQEPHRGIREQVQGNFVLRLTISRFHPALCFPKSRQ